jgi:hypothetical protein
MRYRDVTTDIAARGIKGDLPRCLFLTPRMNAWASFLLFGFSLFTMFRSCSICPRKSTKITVYNSRYSSPKHNQRMICHTPCLTATTKKTNQRVHFLPLFLSFCCPLTAISNFIDLLVLAAHSDFTSKKKTHPPRLAGGNLLWAVWEILKQRHKHRQHTHHETARARNLSEPSKLGIFAKKFNYLLK